MEFAVNDKLVGVEHPHPPHRFDSHCIRPAAQGVAADLRSLTSQPVDHLKVV